LGKQRERYEKSTHVNFVTAEIILKELLGFSFHLLYNFAAENSTHRFVSGVYYVGRLMEFHR
jgi:hypothetical protein